MGDVIRFEQLAPSWGTPHAREPGHMRWIVCYYGGREGYINDNPETGLFSDRTVTGLMWLQNGGRQYGVHEHTVAEIYVILKGQVESIEPGHRHLAGPLDCLYIPPGAPHAVRAVGDEDVLLLWCHDRNEKIGASQYYDEADDRWGPDTPRVKLVRWTDLEPSWDAPGAREGGTMRSSVGWAGPAQGELAIDPAVSASSDRVFLGSTALPPGNAHVPHAHPFTEHYVVVSGCAAVLGDATSRALEPLDYVGFQPGEVHGLRAVGTEPLRLLWLQEEIRPDGGGSEYEGR